MPSLLPYNTFHLNAQARVLEEYHSVTEVQQLLNLYRGEKLLPLGAGSDVLFTQDFNGVVLHSAMREWRIVNETDSDLLLEAESGLMLDELIAELVKRNFTGLENLSLIPGTIGGAVVQNAGAYGVEIKDVVTAVNAVSVNDGSLHTFMPGDCQFAYRNSAFKHQLRNFIITSVCLRLGKGGAPTLTYGGLNKQLAPNATPAQVREAVIRIRRSKLPDVEDLGSAGSFFTNPVVSSDKMRELRAFYPDMPHFGNKIPCAWLIEQCGLKGARCGGAQIYPKQPLVIVNTGNATADDIMRLADKVVNAIRNKFNIIVTPEVNYI